MRRRMHGRARDLPLTLRTLRLFGAVLVLAAGLFIGARPIGPAPALGDFLEPAHGVWSLARAASSPAAPDARLL